MAFREADINLPYFPVGNFASGSDDSLFFDQEAKARTASPTGNNVA
jgi:hypothetical protein